MSPRRVAVPLALAGAAAVLWLALGMDRGLLLSNGIKSMCWPWAPFQARRTPVAEALSDPVWQFVPWLELAGRELRAGRLPLWNPHQDGGVPLLGNAQSALGTPLVWPALLLGVRRGWNLSLLLKLLLALGGAWAFLRERGRSAPAAALGAAAFALSGAFVAWLEHPQTFAAAPVPLLLLYAGRLSERPKGRDVIGLALATYLVLAGGHPETALMAALLCGGWVLALAPAPRRWLPPLGGAFLGAALAAPLLLPFLEYFARSEAARGAARTSRPLPLSALIRFVIPSAGGSHPIAAAATVSLALLVLIPVGLALVRSDREVAFWSGASAVLLLAAYDGPFARFLATATPVFWTRTLLLLPLALGCVGAAGLDLLLARASRAGRERAAKCAAWLLAAVAGIELLGTARGVHSITPPAELALSTPLLARIASDPEPFHILPLHTFLPANSATLLALDDLRGYDALGVRAWRERRAAIGRFTNTPTVVDIVEPWDLAPGGAALDVWSVKYLLLHPQFAFGAPELSARLGLDLAEVYSGPDGRILVNRRAKPRVRLEGAPGSARIVSRTPTRWTMRTEASAPSDLVVANPMFPGWRAAIDGNPSRIESEAGDLIRIPVLAGTHEVVLEYRPTSFRLGLGIAALGAVLALVTARRLPSA
jgi:Bacterial membrane protein YfhO